jgi:putative acyl-CoA dehydrogenase
MRRAVTEAVHHCSHREAFGSTLMDQPLMNRVLADLVRACDGATALAFRVAGAFDAGESGDEREQAFARIATPMAKYWLNKLVVPVVHEAMEAHGGAGYVEENPLPRYFRQSPLNGIWEGSGNVMALDVLRAMAKTPAAREALMAELSEAASLDAALNKGWERVQSLLASDIGQADARTFLEEAGPLLQASALSKIGDEQGLAAFLAGGVTPTASAGARDLGEAGRFLLDRQRAALNAARSMPAH